MAKIGSRVIVRTYSAGVHYGTLASQSEDGKRVTLTDARRIWRWEGAFTISAIAVNGLANSSKLSVATPDCELTEAIEVLTCTDKAIASIDKVEAWNP